MIFKLIAVNEISLLRQSKQTANLQIKINKKNLIKELVSDGVLYQHQQEAPHIIYLLTVLYYH